MDRVVYPQHVSSCEQFMQLVYASVTKRHLISNRISTHQASFPGRLLINPLTVKYFKRNC